MDVWPLNLKGGSGVPVFPAMRMHEKLKLEPPSTRIEVNVSARRGMLTSRYRSVLVRAGDGGKKKDSDGDSSSPGNNDPLIPEEDNLHGNIQPNDLTKKSHGSLSDWRDFRANLVAWEQEHLRDPDPHSKETSSHEPAQKSSLKWAHPIPMPETGCVLVATEKLDGVPSFERTVVLLLRSGSRDIRDGPFGIILNRPLHRKIRHMKPSNPDLATIFADCSVYFGGPLEASMFLVRTGQQHGIASLLEKRI
ncbi:hypothetical protein Cni_G24398 [Canna indica]|uniref:Uncharacterized protein n=1 Tax=Canna indica TaxID=4628 RepID=A0AAQ3L2B8_9LILI|nr:hypothetical protein Cni_G24398 [Canna indica]